MWTLLIKIVIQIAIMMILASRTNQTEAPAAKVSDFNFPTAEETRNQMLLYGTRKVSGSNNFFADDVSQKPIKKDGGFLVGDIEVGTRYYVGFALGICFGGETFLEKIAIKDEEVWNFEESGSSYDENGRLRSNINKPELHGEDNGIGGNFTFYQGSETQLPDAYMNKFSRFSGFRGLSYVVFEKFYVGNSTSVSVFDFYLKRIPTTNTELDNYADIDGNCNPAVVVYDILTNEDYGIGQSVDLIDFPSFLACAKTLKDENIGLSITYEDKYECDAFVSEVLKTIAGTLVEDANTGKFKLKLTRDDYDIDDIFELNTSNIISVLSYARNTREKLYNEVKVKYYDKDSFYKERYEQFQNEALFIENIEGNNSYDIAYPWITDSQTAINLAARDGIPTSVYMSTMELETARIYGLEVGDPIKVKFEPYGIEQLIYRISEIDYGTFRNNTMKISLIQDNFGIQASTYKPSPPSKWPGFDFSAKPCDINIIEAPYFFDSQGFDILTYGEEPNGVALNYDLYTKRTDESIYNFNGKASAFTPVATVSEEIGVNDYISSLNLTGELEDIVPRSSGQDDKKGYNLCLIVSSSGQEFIDFENITLEDEEYTITKVRRGLLDTIPKAHPADSKIYFITYGLAFSKEYSFNANDEIQIKPLTRTSSELLNIADANEFNFTFGANPRNQMPSTPINLEVNGRDFWNEDLYARVDLRFNWLMRYYEELQYVSDYKTSQEPPFSSGGQIPGVIPSDVVIEIYDPSNTLIKTIVEPVGTSYPLTGQVVFDDETTINPDGEYYDSLRIRVYSRYNSITSFDKYDFTIVRA